MSHILFPGSEVPIVESRKTYSIFLFGRVLKRQNTKASNRLARLYDCIDSCKSQIDCLKLILRFCFSTLLNTAFYFPTTNHKEPVPVHCFKAFELIRSLVFEAPSSHGSSEYKSGPKETLLYISYIGVLIL